MLIGTYLELARLNLVALDTLRELDLEWRGGMALTYLAVCLLSIDRPIRLCAANLWGELVEKDLIDNAALGRVLGEDPSVGMGSCAESFRFGCRNVDK